MKNVLAVLLLTILVSCSTQRELYTDNPHTLEFGTSGGFTNQNTVYVLESDGDLWQFRSPENDSSLLKQLKKSATRKLFKEAYALGLDSLQLNRAGNMNQFIRFRSASFDNHLQWPKDSGQVPENVSAFYRSLTHLITTN